MGHRQTSELRQMADHRVLALPLRVARLSLSAKSENKCINMPVRADVEMVLRRDKRLEMSQSI